MTEKLPSVVIVGRPNVGKSTIFNRLTGTRRSIVTDEPGITRDRIYGTATWQERSFEVVDTGGIVPDDKAAIPREILRQAQVAIEGASQLLLVVDVRAGLTPLDSELARLLRRTGKPLAILANKVDTQMQESLAAPFYELSNDVFPVSAEHGYGFDTLLEAITARLGAAGPGLEETPVSEKQDQQVNVAIIGRPNVGKSTMLNRLSGVDRAIVSDIPGSWKITPNFTLTYGLKYGRDTGRTDSDLGAIPCSVQSFFTCTGNLLDQFGFASGLGNPIRQPNTNFGPQVGFAWDPTKNGKTVIRAGGGI